MARMHGAALVFVAVFTAACGPLATGPLWAGGGMALTGAIGVPSQSAASEVGDGDTANGAANQPEGERVGARHILVMHSESKARPEHVVRTKAEARARAEECLSKLAEGAEFSELVERYTDEPRAAERGGDLGVFGRDAMVKPFTDAVFLLAVGQVSGVVETAYGFHIIKRTR